MRWPRRGILIRLFIYVPLIAILAWRAQGGCGDEETTAADDDLEHKLAPHRRVITLPDGTQQQIVEVTPEQAEAILGHPIPEFDEGNKADVRPDPVDRADARVSPGQGAPVDAGAGAEAAADQGAGSRAKVDAEAKADAEAVSGAKADAEEKAAKAGE